MSKNELDQRLQWIEVGCWRVYSELFLDLVFTNDCNCACPWCIARTRQTAQEDRPAWEQALRDAFAYFPIKSVILLGGEATVDPAFFEKLEFVERELAAHPVEHLILTTNGIRLTQPRFLDRLLGSGIDAVNLSRMHWDQAENDRIFRAETPTIPQIGELFRALRARGKTLRVNVNVWRGNLDSVEALLQMIQTLSGLCDAVKLTPLMRTELFDTVPQVTACAERLALSEAEIRSLWDALAERCQVLRRNRSVLGFVEYAELEYRGQRVLLKYAQVEDKYDRQREIPTLKLYPNGCLSNEWSFARDVRPGLAVRCAGI